MIGWVGGCVCVRVRDTHTHKHRERERQRYRQGWGNKQTDKINNGKKE